MVFRRNYTVRVYSPQEFQHGYAVQGYEDKIANLDVQPESNTISSTTDGFETVTRLRVFGDFPFTAANQASQRKGDRLLWHGEWYECTSSVYWDGTPLHHYLSLFTAVPDGRNDL